jgi:hypothetical protein
MNNQESPDTKPDFTCRSETESICTYCSQTIKTDRFTPLEYVEDIHADVCLFRQSSPARYDSL